MEFWTNNIDAVWELSKAYHNNGLTIFLGAGVSRGCGLPLWPQLVDDLYIEACRYNYHSAGGVYGSYDDPKGWGGLQKAISGLESKALGKLSLPIKSRFCKRRLGKIYEKSLQAALYKNKYTVSSAVNSLLELRNLKAICTFNYDDLIEINGKKGQFYSVNGCEKRRKTGIPVYHVHGMLPSDLSKKPKGDIVFSEDEYHSLYLNFGHWSNLVQLSLLLESDIVVFIGLSFEDPNLRRLLDGAKSARKELKLLNICRLPFDRPLHSSLPLDTKKIEISVLNEVYKNIGVENLWIDNYDPDISILLESIAAKDPVENFTRRFRAHLKKKLIAKGTSNKKCLIHDCSNNRVKESEYCIAHTMGDEKRFMDYAPTPKTLNDQCIIKNCKRITSGLSDTCKKHSLHFIKNKSSGRKKP